MGNSGAWTPPPFSGNNEWTSDVFGKGMIKTATGAWTYEINEQDTPTNAETSKNNDGDD
jgi:hypothetical protein